VAPLLRAAGHDVYTPTLTGLGERVHLARPEVGLDTHTQDFVNLLHFEDLQEVVLLGHTFGGITITDVADKVPERLQHLVYLDAVVPLDGESRFDSMDPQARAALEEKARVAGDGWRVPSPIVEDLPSAADNQSITSRLTPQPLKTYQDKLRLGLPRARCPSCVLRDSAARAGRPAEQPRVTSDPPRCQDRPFRRESVGAPDTNFGRSRSPSVSHHLDDLGRGVGRLAETLGRDEQIVALVLPPRSVSFEPAQFEHQHLADLVVLVGTHPVHPDLLRYPY
jgi:pimeloyl-ACP methyl ester carboxylesterase